MSGLSSFSGFDGFLGSWSACSTFCGGGADGLAAWRGGLASGSGVFDGFVETAAGSSGSTGAKTLSPLPPGTRTMGLLGGADLGGTHSGVLVVDASPDSSAEGGVKGMSCSRDCNNLFNEVSSGVDEDSGLNSVFSGGGALGEGLGGLGGP